MKKIKIPLLLVVAIWAFSPPTVAGEGRELSAAERARSDALVQSGVGNYSDRRYEDAIRDFTEAFELLNEPELLYNIARCHERLANVEEAIEWYQRFLEMPGTTGDLRTRALTNIAALKREMAAKKAAEKTGPVPADGKSAPSAGESDSDENQAGGSPKSSKRNDGGGASDGALADEGGAATGKPGSTASTLKIVGWSLTGCGVAAMIAGGVFGGLALGARNDYDDAGLDPDRLDYRDDVERKALVFDVVFSSGAALTVAGISLIVAHVLKSGAKHETANTNGGVGRRSLRLAPSLGVGQQSFIGGMTGHF